MRVHIKIPLDSFDQYAENVEACSADEDQEIALLKKLHSRVERSTLTTLSHIPRLYYATSRFNDSVFSYSLAEFFLKSDKLLRATVAKGLALMHEEENLSNFERFCADYDVGRYVPSTDDRQDNSHWDDDGSVFVSRYLELQQKLTIYAKQHNLL